MIRNILSLFRKEPSEPLQDHLLLVSECVVRVPQLIHAVESNDQQKLFKLKEEINQYEEKAEKIKSALRGNLLGSLYLSIDRSIILEILILQDKLANIAKDIAFLLTVRPFLIDPYLIKPLHEVVQKNIETFLLTKDLLQELPTLFETSFSGIEAEKAILMIEQIATKEREADLLQTTLLQVLLTLDDKLSPGQFHIYNKVFECISSISNISERLALAVRATLVSSG